MTVEAEIRQKLVEAFSPVALEIINESQFHASHASSPGTGESHFRVLIVASAFEGKSRLQRHRMVNELLSAELNAGVHALAIKAMSPAEAAA